MYDPYMIHVWSMYDPDVIHIWSMYDPYMIHVWSIYDPYMIPIWSIHDPYMIHIWSMHDPFMIHVWKWLDVNTSSIMPRKKTPYNEKHVWMILKRCNFKNTHKSWYTPQPANSVCNGSREQQTHQRGMMTPPGPAHGTRVFFHQRTLHFTATDSGNKDVPGERGSNLKFRTERISKSG